MASNSFQWERRHCLGKGSGALGITRSAHEHFDEILQEILEMLGGSEGGLFAIEGHVLADRGPVWQKINYNEKNQNYLSTPFPHSLFFIASLPFVYQF